MAKAASGRQVPADTLTTLQFVKDLPKGRRLPDGRSRTFWAPECDGLDDPASEALGIRYALEAARYMAEERFPPLLGWAALDMMTDPKAADRLVRVAFFEMLAELAIAAVRAGFLPALERDAAEREAQMRRFHETGVLE